jgi:NAD-dependent deacetylase
MDFAPELIHALRQAKSIVVLSGAGISAESGVPTFRDALTGLWSKFKPEELGTPQAFRANPKLVWDWYAWRRETVKSVAPNPGHYALAEMEKCVGIVTIITQNVDGLHQRAGSTRVIELHGNISRVKCSAENTPYSEWVENGAVPLCPACGAFLRPDIVWFGEQLPREQLGASYDACDRADVFLSIGTSSVVQPAASLPIYAQNAGALLVEINPDATPLSKDAKHVLRGASGVVLPALSKAVWPH